jgi:hypothetical protein
VVARAGRGRDCYRYPLDKSVNVGAAVRIGSATPIESEAVDKGVEGDTPSMAEDVINEDRTVTDPSHE